MSRVKANEINDYDLSNLKEISVRGLRYLVAPRYIEHYVQNDYEAYTLDLFLQHIKDGSTVVDIGAHYGIYSLLAAKKASKVIAFEPIEDNRTVLTENIRNNGINNIVINEAAVSNKSGSATFNLTGASDSSGFYEHPLIETLKKITVKTTSLDDQELPPNIGVIKIDTEGHEISVLQGAEKTLRANPDAVLFIEFNPQCLISAGHQPEDLFYKIHELGYESYIIDDKGYRTYKVNSTDAWAEILGTRNYANLICIPKAKALSVLFFSHSSLVGGAELGLLETIISLKERGTFCSVILPEEGPLSQKLNAMQINYDVVPFSLWGSKSVLDITPSLELSLLNLKAVENIRNLIQKYRYDVVLTNSIAAPWAAIAASQLRSSHAWVIHEFGNQDHGFKFPLAYEDVLVSVDELSHSVITHSQAVTDHISPHIERNKITQAYLPLTTTLSHSKAKIANIFKQSTHLKLVLIGRIIESKGQLDAVRAIELMVSSGRKDIELIIVGSSGNTAYLRKIKSVIANAGLSNKIRILKYSDNPVGIMKQSDAVLVCSANEAFGRVTAEALYVGKAVIGADSGGTSEMLTQSNGGITYQAGDIDSLTNALIQAYDKKQVLKKLGIRGREWAKKMINEQVYSEKVYKSLLNTKNTAPKLVSPTIYPFLLEGIAGYTERSNEIEKSLSEARNLIDMQETTIKELSLQLQRIKSRVPSPLKKAYRIYRKVRPYEKK